MANNYNRWYEKFGVIIEDETKAWINEIPTHLDIVDVIGDVTDFIAVTLRDAYTAYQEENEHIEMQYEEKQSQELLEGYCY